MSRFLQIILLLFFCQTSFADQANLKNSLDELQQLIAVTKYQTSSTEEQIANYNKCQETAISLSNTYKQAAEPIIMQARCLASSIKLAGSPDLKKLKQAKKLFEQAIKLDPNAFSGSTYASLATLYAKAPGWPIAFGDKDKAEEYFQEALKISADDMDTNFFYAEYLAENGQEEEALKYYNLAKSSKAKENKIADEGRKKEIETAIKKLQAKF